LLLAPKHPVPVFPLPNVVLFPHAVTPLHVFELRYRTMVRDALSGERLIALALLKPGYERDYHGSPEFFDVGCLAEFDDVVWLTNDCYDLRVKGATRVRFDRIVREFPYRSARVTPLPEEPFTDDDPLVQLEKRALLDTFARLLKAGAPDPVGLELDMRHRYDVLVNAMCACADAGPFEKLALLRMDSVLERGRRVRELTERRLQRFSHPRPEGGERN